jgi:hypothetical protein
MSDEARTRLEAMIISLRDQVDSLSDRVESRLADQQLLLTRLRLDVAQLKSSAPREVASTAPTSRRL